MCCHGQCILCVLVSCYGGILCVLLSIHGLGSIASYMYMVDPLCVPLSIKFYEC